MDVAETSVSLAFSWSSEIVFAPQLLIVARIFPSVSATFSFKLPA
jgi:hypothetical protein